MPDEKQPDNQGQLYPADLKPHHSEKHWMDDFIVRLVDSNLITSAAIIFALGSICASLMWKDWMWFARSGSLITIAGILLLSSKTFRLGIYKSQASMNAKPSCIVQGGGIVTASSTDKSIGLSVLRGIVVSIAGTIIWGYGDAIMEKVYPLKGKSSNFAECILENIKDAKTAAAAHMIKSACSRISTNKLANTKTEFDFSDAVNPFLDGKENRNSTSPATSSSKPNFFDQFDEPNTPAKN